jgi:hypothetical protein
MRPPSRIGTISGNLGIILAAFAGMTENPTDGALASLLTQAEAMLSAGPAFWWQAGLRVESPENLAAAIRAAREAECATCGALAERLEAVVQREALDRDVWDFIVAARDSLRRSLGRQWSQDWARIGLPNTSQQIPAQLERRLLVLRLLGEYFRLNPQQQREIAGLTCERAHKLALEVKNAIASVDHCCGELRHALDARTQAIAELKRIMRCLTAELHQLLRGNDPRWLTAYAKERVETPEPDGSEAQSVETPAVAAGGQRAGKQEAPAAYKQDAVARGGRQRRTAVTALVGANRLTHGAVLAPPTQSRAISPTPHRPCVDLSALALPALLAWLFPPNV